MIDTGLFALMYFGNRQTYTNLPILRIAQFRNAGGYPQTRNQPESFKKNWKFKDAT